MGFKYQAIARDLNGNLIKNQDISLRISILGESEDGKVIFSETHEVATNALGLINLEIGKGLAEKGDFAKINWSLTNHYVQIEMDKTGGTNYEMMGTSKLLSVPYAMYAATAGTEKSAKSSNYWSGTENTTSIIKRTGSVAIGTNSNPIEKLHVQGDVYIPNGYSFWIGSNSDAGSRLRMQYYFTLIY